MDNKIWLRAQYEFASLFSYRLPDFSSSYALSAPMPGPSAAKLAFVATAIEKTGTVSYGKHVFNLIMDAIVALEPPPELAVSRVLVRRLKQQSISRQKTTEVGVCPICGRENAKLYPSDDQFLCSQCGLSLIQSYGIREYVHFGGPITIYLEIEREKDREISGIMQRLRRVGTSDSLMYCHGVSEQAPDPSIVARLTTDLKTLSAQHEIIRRPAFLLKDIREGTNFNQVNPFYRGKVSRAKGKEFLESKLYIFPLKVHKQGRNWVWYKREPFLNN